MYTYKRQKCKRIADGFSFITNGLGYPPIENGYGAIHYKSWVILNSKGRKIAEATSEKQAKVITEALNGKV